MKIALEFITPERAEQLLRLNIQNRPANASVVEQYAQLMLAGKWRENGDTIRIGSDNVLLDGQHRLLAAVRANYTLRCPVVTELDPIVFGTIDRQYIRTPGQIFSVAGISHATVAAGLCRTVVEYDGGRLGMAFTKGGGRRLGVSPEELITHYLKNEATYETALRRASWLHDQVRFLTPTDWAFLFVVLHRTGAHEEAEAFLDQLATGAGLPAGDVLLWVRNTFFKAMTAVQDLPRYQKMAYILTAWNKVRAGQRKANFIRLTPEAPFPAPR